MREFGPRPAGAFGFELRDACLSGAGDALVGAHHDALDAECAVERSERQHHLDGGAVRIGDEAVLRRQDTGVDFRHHEGDGGMHPPERGIVDDAAAGGGKAGSQLLADGTAGAEQG